MMKRVYQFGLRPPTTNAAIVRAQLRHAHDYANDLTAIERGRRWALRQIDNTPEVAEALAVVRAATKSTRKAAVAQLRDARRAAREAVPEELARIAEREHELLLSARANTPTYWGSYLDIEAAHRQSRQMPLYGDDAIEPNEPRFVAWRGVEPPSGTYPRLPQSNEGQIAVQLQGGLTTADAYAGRDTRVRLIRGGAKDGDKRYGFLHLRVGSEGRDPVWAVWPVKISREIPDAASWKWVRVSLRHEGRNERWSCEITVDDSAPAPRALDTQLSGAIAVEWEWSEVDGGGMRVARWADDRGKKGEVVLAPEVVRGIRKPDGIRAVRDMIDVDFRPKLQRLIREANPSAPKWLLDESTTMHLWKSPRRLYALATRWMAHSDVAPKARAEVMAWLKRDEHLWDYEACSRGQALRRRRDVYRNLAATWARSYRTALLSDQDLSREARFGPESDRRFTAGCAELRSAIRNAFGSDALDARWRDKPDEEDESGWCERARDAWVAGGARADAMFTKRKEQTGNAWAERKKRSSEKKSAQESARKAADNAAE